MLFPVSLHRPKISQKGYFGGFRQERLDTLSIATVDLTHLQAAQVQVDTDQHILPRFPLKLPLQPDKMPI